MSRFRRVLKRKNPKARPSSIATGMPIPSPILAPVLKPPLEVVNEDAGGRRLAVVVGETLDVEIAEEVTPINIGVVVDVVVIVVVGEEVADDEGVGATSLTEMLK